MHIFVRQNIIALSQTYYSHYHRCSFWVALIRITVVLYLIFGSRLCISSFNGLYGAEIQKSVTTFRQKVPLGRFKCYGY
jgi:L-asparagine transporter-like permease